MTDEKKRTAPKPGPKNNPETETERVVEPERAPEPAPREIPKSPYAVVGKGVRDDVRASVGEGSPNSLSTHHIQRRLAERGFPAVYEDRDGFWRAGTTRALSEFAESESLQDAPHRKVLEALFEGDSNVWVVD